MRRPGCAPGLDRHPARLGRQPLGQGVFILWTAPFLWRNTGAFDGAAESRAASSTPFPWGNVGRAERTRGVPFGEHPLSSRGTPPSLGGRRGAEANAAQAAVPW